MWFLTINSGSSSIKYSLFKVNKRLSLAEKGVVEKIGEEQSFFKTGSRVLRLSIPDHHKAIDLILDAIKREIKDISSLAGIGHRVVHGGEKFKESVVIDSEVLNYIKKCSHLAPLHNPPAVLSIEASVKLLKSIPQIAVFDTAFHHTIPDYAYNYAIPYKFYRQYKIRRYGFHGTSHHYIALEAAKVLNKKLKDTKIISCHLGNGCSITAINGGRSIDTSMGFTPLEGLVMGTRSGDIDPAIVLFLEERGFNYTEIDKILNRESGLLGISGLSNDMRAIERAMLNKNKRAHLAYNIFLYRLIKYISSYIGILEGVDAVILTGGIGENQVRLKRDIKKRLKSILDKFDARVLVIPTDEELMIAREGLRLLKR
ncbi:MAG: acetate kinase [Candidatus Kaelpia imicola]|nr:acetate kinase [Candidatus Kaelpia imicola]